MIKWTNYFNSSDNYNTIMDALMVIDASNDVVNTGGWGNFKVIPLAPRI